MNDEPSLINTVLTYCYGISIFSATCTTIAAAYKLLERILNLTIGIKGKGKREHVIIMGYNDDVKSLVEHFDDNHRNICIHIITDKSIEFEERYTLIKKRVQHTYF